MKQFYQKYKTLILFSVVAVVVAFGALYFFGGAEEPALVSQGAQGSATDAASRELLSQLLELRSLSLDDQIFAAPSFNALEDFGQELAPQSVGRRNPFAPLGVE